MTTHTHPSKAPASRTARSLLSAASAASLVLAAAALFGAPAQAQDNPVDLKISLWVPPAHPLVAATKEWAASMEKASGGTIKATIFPAEQLGKAFDHYDMARDGIADITYVSPGYQPGRFPIVNAAQLPFMIANGRGGSAAVDEWYRKYAAREMKDVKVCLSFVHDPGSLHSRKKVVAPQDLKGLKVRPAQGTVGEMVTLLGGANVQASAPESREILERYHIDAPLYTTAYVWAMNKDKYDGMSSAQKKVIDDHCTNDWAAKMAGPWADYEAAGRDKMRSTAGHEVYALTPDQLAQWRKAVEPMTKSWSDAVRKAGADPDAALSELKASIEKHKAGL
jgi:TRAP-type transport system periplasmic protein